VRPVARAVGRLLRGLGIETEVARVEAIDRWETVAVDVFGPDGALTRAVAVDTATLVVAVPTSAWASEIRLRQTDLLDRLSRSAPSSGITAIRTIPASRRW